MAARVRGAAPPWSCRAAVVVQREVVADLSVDSAGPPRSCSARWCVAWGCGAIEVLQDGGAGAG